MPLEWPRSRDRPPTRYNTRAHLAHFPPPYAYACAPCPCVHACVPLSHAHVCMCAPCVRAMHAPALCPAGKFGRHAWRIAYVPTVCASTMPALVTCALASPPARVFPQLFNNLSTGFPQLIHNPIGIFSRVFSTGYDRFPQKAATFPHPRLLL
jgi:hypothetical protein